MRPFRRGMATAMKDGDRGVPIAEFHPLAARRAAGTRQSRSIRLGPTAEACGIVEGAGVRVVERSPLGCRLVRKLIRTARTPRALTPGHGGRDGPPNGLQQGTLRGRLSRKAVGTTLPTGRVGQAPFPVKPSRERTQEEGLEHHTPRGDA